MIDRSLYETIPIKTSSDKNNADLCWLIYELSLSEKTNRFQLMLFKKIYEGFADSIQRMTEPKIGSVDDFISDLEKKLREEINFLEKNYGVWAFSQLLKNPRYEYALQESKNITIQPRPI